MYIFLVSLSKYLFLFCILYFLLSSFIFVANEKFNLPFKVSKNFILISQRVCIFVFNLLGFLILSWIDNKGKFNFTILHFGAICIIYTFLANFLSAKIYKNSCPIIWNGLFFIISIGIVMLTRLNFPLAEKQLLWLIISFFVLIIVYILLNLLPNLSYFKYLYLFFGVGLLISTLIYGTSVNGAKNWINITSFASFQPSELVKILFVLYLACVFKNENIKFRNLIFPSIISFIFIVCLVLQTDLGSALIFSMTYLVLVYIRTSSIPFISFCILLGSFSSILAYKLFYHVKIRVDVWLNPFADINNSGYQICQSLFAINSNGLLGSGLRQGYPNYIPVVEKDFIFSAICEEFGMLFAICLILLFLLIFYRGVKIALNCENNFLSFVTSGLISIFCFQSFLIIGGVTKFIPMTGVTLPFVSYGGSSLSISFITIGIIQWIATKTPYISFYHQNHLVRRNIKRVFYIYLFMFLCIIAYMIKFNFSNENNFKNHPNNPRSNLTDII